MDGPARRDERPRSEAAVTWAIASAGLTLFALFTRMLAAGGHAPGVDSNAQHGETMAVVLLLALAAVSGLRRVAPRAWRGVRRGRPNAYLATTVLVIVLAGFGQWLAAATGASVAAGWLAARRSD